MSSVRAHATGNCWCGHTGPSHYAVGEAVACRQCARPQQIEEAPMLLAERRRFDRFAMPHPIRTSLGSSPAYVVDASIAGLGVLQHASAPAVGSTFKLMFQSDFGPITVECEVARSSVKDGTCQTGLRIVAADDESESRLRMLVMTLAIPSATNRGH